MSLLTTASLVVTPNAGDEGTLFSIVPSSGAGDMNVVRATTATRVNSAGLVELVPYNLAQYSEQIDNAIWTKVNNTISANAITAPNGTLTADKLQDSDNSFTAHLVLQNCAFENTQQTFSVYFKKAEYNYGHIHAQGLAGAVFDINTGVVVSVGGGTATIEDAGNGWFRCAYTFTSTASATVYFNQAKTSTSIYSYTGTTGYGIYAWGAQLVEGTLPKDYQKTETRLNIPRLDYSNGTCPSLLVEPQRTNVCRYSNNLSGADWINQTANTTLTRIQSGGANGGAFDRLVTTGSGAQGRYVQTSTLSGSNAVWSVYLRGTGQVSIGMYNLGQSNVTDVTLTSEWTRYESKITAGITGYMDFSIYVFGGASVDVSSCQLEFATYATSYIPTTSASVTRNADVISKTGISSLIGQTEGTLFLDVDFNNLSQLAGVDTLMTLNNGTTDNEISILLDTPSGANKTFLGYIRNAATNQAIIYAASPITATRYKVALSYKLNDVVLYINGTQIGTDTSATIPSTSALSLNSRSDNSFLNIQQEYVQASALWKTRLTNTQLAQLTTI